MFLSCRQNCGFKNRACSSGWDYQIKKMKGCLDYKSLVDLDWNRRDFCP